MSLPTIDPPGRWHRRRIGPTPVHPAAAVPPVPRKGDEEAVKSTGSFVNSIAAGVAITGGLAPPLAFLNGTISDRIALWQVMGAAVVFFFTAAALHAAGRSYVKRELNR